jgi:hypothetical protein
MADIEMKPAEEKTKGEEKDEKKEEGKKEETKPPPSPVADIKSNIALIERAVSTLEPRFTHRVLRTLTSLRKRIDDKVLRDAIEELYPKGELFAVEVWDNVIMYWCRRVCEDIVALMATTCTCGGSIYGRRPCPDTFKDSRDGTCSRGRDLHSPPDAASLAQIGRNV